MARKTLDFVKRQNARRKKGRPPKGREKKTKIDADSAPRANLDGDITTPISPSTQTRGYDKERLSLLLSSRLARAIRARAREMGISFNAFMSSAAYNALNPPLSVPSGQPVVQHITHLAPQPRSSPEKTAEDKLKKFGRAYLGPADPDGGGRPRATWDDCIRYDRAIKQLEANGQKTIPTYEEMAKQLGMPRQTAFACSLAYDDPHYTEYMDLRYGPDVWQHFMDRTADVEQGGTA